MLQQQIVYDTMPRNRDSTKSTSKKQKTNSAQSQGLSAHSRQYSSHPQTSRPYPAPYDYPSELSSSRQAVPQINQSYIAPEKIQTGIDNNGNTAPLTSVIGHSATYHGYSTPVIDTLPKFKQRQVYSYISGLQGGIEHLEKQLNSLKALLGIDDHGDG